MSTMLIKINELDRDLRSLVLYQVEDINTMNNNSEVRSVLTMIEITAGKSSSRLSAIDHWNVLII